ncbi:hypothetical protein GCM10023258_11300 [Terrabacter aeriphilus]|uniref:GatB/YqeY domain-containing protein n=1 Tax=Terrabacter aeriphilus TaxID=515662 RepID=A0ABP9J5X4_9MICO
MDSPLRTALRSRLTTAMRARDREAVSVLRTAVAAIENAEAVPVGEAPVPATSGDGAGAALGLGAGETRRRTLDDAAERSVVEAEVRSLVEAQQLYAGTGDRDRAQRAAAGVALLEGVLAELPTGRS